MPTHLIRSSVTVARVIIILIIIIRSNSIKCPCVGYHLAGTKKVQQVLAKSGALERYDQLALSQQRTATYLNRYLSLLQVC